MEWIDRDHIFVRYGGHKKDPIEETTAVASNASLKTDDPTMDKTEQEELPSEPPLPKKKEKKLISIEELWQAPIEFQDL